MNDDLPSPAPSHVYCCTSRGKTRATKGGIAQSIQTGLARRFAWCHHAKCSNRCAKVPQARLLAHCVQQVIHRCLGSCSQLSTYAGFYVMLRVQGTLVLGTHYLRQLHAKYAKADPLQVEANVKHARSKHRCEKSGVNQKRCTPVMLLCCNTAELRSVYMRIMTARRARPDRSCRVCSQRSEVWWLIHTSHASVSVSCPCCENVQPPSRNSRRVRIDTFADHHNVNTHIESTLLTLRCGSFPRSRMRCASLLECAFESTISVR